MDCGQDFHECPLGAVNRTVTPLDAALHYADLGYAVLPLGSFKSIPHHKLPARDGNRGGVYHATKDKAQLTEWFEAWPNANLALAMGSASGCLALDIDLPRSIADQVPEIVEVLDMVEEKVWATTPSGGRHILLGLPDAFSGTVGNSVKLTQGLDTRGDGGYITAAPSIRLEPESQAEIRYLWEVHPTAPADLPRAPQELVDLINRAPSSRMTVHDLTSRAFGSGYLGHWAESEFLETGFPTGARNSEAHRLACRLWRRRLNGAIDESEVWETMRQAWEQTSQEPPFPWKECEAAALSAKKFIENDRPPVEVSDEDLRRLRAATTSPSPNRQQATTA